jgi:fatty-acyl-CoA synthase
MRRLAGPPRTLAGVVRAAAVLHGEKVALLSHSQSFTFNQLAEVAARYASWASSEHAAGEVICLLAPNSPAYAAIWLGITDVGRIAALINTSLSDDTLIHAIRSSRATSIIVAPELERTVLAVRKRLSGLRCWSVEPGGAFLPVKSRGAADAHHPTPDLRESALLIYTSGTTGFPKPAIVSHRRVLEWSYWFAGMLDVQPSDRMYNCLPMYHSVGGVVAIGAMLVEGASVMISPRFSASRFWDDVVTADCTMFQYIGELCRYLVRSPVHPREHQHRLRLCCGNGLRAEIWEAFQHRFKVPRIVEFYAATEGNVSLYNCDDKPGAIGKIPSFLAHRFPIALIRTDPETEEPERTADGFCVRCPTGEIGEAIGKISRAEGEQGRSFEGYLDRDASAGKILRNVFRDGDAWYRTGDLMRRDGAGFFYFVDRAGDTFRWKGENVATQEVASVILQWGRAGDVMVYGVVVPGHEGQAGMAALTVSSGFDGTDLYRYLAVRLPEYACPMFLRLCEQIPMTETFKQSKVLFRCQGIDPRVTGDPIYVRDRLDQAYVRLTPERYHQITQGLLQL